MSTLHRPPHLLNFCVCLLLVLPFLATWTVQAASPITVNPSGTGAMGEQAIVVSGPGFDSSGNPLPDTTVNLNSIQTELNKTPAGIGLLMETVDGTGQHIWTLKRSLLVQKGVVLHITGGMDGAAEGAQVDWLRLCSDPGVVKDENNPGPFYSHFVSLRSKDANLIIKGATITSWDTKADTYDTNITDGRAYVVAKGQSRMDITKSDLSYLGSADDESYGVAWRDTDTDANGPRTRVTGDVTLSSFSHNYYGLYTFQAGNMHFTHNKMFSNIEYGFDPHDYTHDVDVEYNESYDNGSHGYIISRGCKNFTFKYNLSHDNKVRTGSKNPSAHGFMLDPGADPVKAGVPQAPSTNNVYMYNQTYNNDGYGFRILQSNNNTIQHNSFTNNRAGISLEGGSTGNLVDDNTISGSTGLTTNGVLSQGYGIQIVTGADVNTVTNNTITSNAVNGINVKTGKNSIQGNTVTSNTGNGINIAKDTGGSDETEPPADGTTPPPTTTTVPNANQLIGNTVSANTSKGIAINAASSTFVQGNTLHHNGGPGLSITGSETGTLAEQNTIDTNSGYGIEVYGSSSQANTFTQNSITANTSNAISVRSSANASMTAPVVKAQGAGTVTGTSQPNAMIEVFSDDGSQAKYAEGTTIADSAGAFTYTFSSVPQGTYVTFSATDSAGNTSPLSAKLVAPQPSATPTAIATATPSAMATPSATATPSPTVDGTATPSATATPSPTTTATPSPTADGTNQPVTQQFKVYLPIAIR